MLFTLFLPELVTCQIVQEIVKKEHNDEFYLCHYLPYVGLSEEYIENHKDQFVKKAKSALKNVNNWDSTYFDVYTDKIRIESYLYNKRVNISKYKEFENLGADLSIYLIDGPNYEKEHDSQDLANSFFYHGLIFSATIIDTFYTKEVIKRKYYGKEVETTMNYINFKLVTDKIIKGEYLFDKFPTNFRLKAEFTYEGFDAEQTEYEGKKIVNLNPSTQNRYWYDFKIGEKIIFFKDINIRNEHIRSLLSGFLMAEFTYMIYENNLNRKFSHFFPTLEDVIEFFCKLEKINDTPNFLIRSFE